MPHDVVGNVFEKLIPPEDRHALGQFFTREELVDLINAFCIQTVNAKGYRPNLRHGNVPYKRLRQAQEHGREITHYPALQFMGC